jgi:hypothetical protein
VLEKARRAARDKRAMRAAVRPGNVHVESVKLRRGGETELIRKGSERAGLN